MYGILQASEDDKTEALELISRIFKEEYGSEIEDNEKNREGDFLIVKNKANEIIGTYRMIKNHGDIKFSNDEFFDFSYFYNHDKWCAELGRASVHPAYRDGKVLQLLWKLIAEYIITNELTYVFGCTSISIQKREKHSINEDLIKIISYMKQKDALTFLPIFPKPEYIRYDFHEWMENHPSEYDKDKDKKIIPTLIKGYTKKGAKFSPYIIQDEKFGSYDFLTIFDTNNESVRELFKT